MGLHNFFTNGMIMCSGRKEIDDAALSLLASRNADELCACVLRAENGRHGFLYDLDGLTPLTSLQTQPSFENAVQVLASALGMIDRCRNAGLALENIKNAEDYIFWNRNSFKFIYLPIKARRNLSVRDYLLKLLSVIRVKDIRIMQLIKGVRNTREDIQTLSYLAEFLRSYGALTEPRGTGNSQAFDEGETSLLSGLSGEGETSLLSGSSNEGETSLLSGFSDEGETSPLSASPSVEEIGLCSEDRKMDGSEHRDFELAEDESSLTEMRTLKPTVFFSDESSEFETTVLTSKPKSFARIPTSEFDAKAVLFLTRGETGETIPIDVTPFTIGKDRANMDYALDCESVSRHHATIIYGNGCYYITDNGSTNGTVVEGIRIQPHERVELGDGYFLALGRETFQVHLEGR